MSKSQFLLGSAKFRSTHLGRAQRDCARRPGPRSVRDAGEAFVNEIALAEGFDRTLTEKLLVCANACDYGERSRSHGALSTTCSLLGCIAVSSLRTARSLTPTFAHGLMGMGLRIRISSERTRSRRSPQRACPSLSKPTEACDGTLK